MRHTYKKDQRKILVTGLMLAGLCLIMKTVGVKTYTDDGLRLRGYSIVGSFSETEAAEVISQTKRPVSASDLFPEYAVPVMGTVSSEFGYRSDPFGSGDAELHSGIDIAVSTGTEVHAFCGGTVTACEYSEIGGNYIKIEHDNGFYSYYGHLSEILVKSGETVSTGQKIALSGSTGKVTGPHLHFQLIYNGRAVDPSSFIFPENSK